ncbi:MAG: hypothetical protein K9G67_09870 [Bacteroidales bacterium]|nr:hypothetical protein [Bacteroidales bacterium]MCF8344690.1 hypothetical protein [Bacteroidales bacterium]MCF8351735.1 hypothetical protein [Bacteroidales bacterium]MCF8376650.1 hypothetical protein [Bacteroidales bacterium]
MKKTIGVILILLTAPGFYFFIDYLIFEFKGHGDDGLGSYAIWTGGMIGLASGLVLLAVGLILIVSASRKTKSKPG